MDADRCLNITSTTTNKTAFDYFCTKMPLGPLLYTIVNVPCACVGAPASVWLLWVLIQRQRRGLTNDVYMLNLTVMDFVYNTLRIPCMMNHIWLRDESILKFGIFLEGFSMNGRPQMTACICVDCYMAVIFPIQYRKVKQTWYRLVVCAFIWLFTPTYQLVYLFPHNLKLIAIPNILAVTIITFCDITVLHALRKPDLSGRNNIHPEKQRALQVITNSFIMTMVSYLPPLVKLGFLSLSWQEVFCSVVMVTLTCYSLGPTIMPLLSLWNLGVLRNIMKSECVSSG